MKHLLLIPLISFLTANSMAAPVSMSNFTAKAQQILSLDKNVQALKRSERLTLKHPVLRQHGNYQTLIYAQAQIEPLDTHRSREWLVLGADIRFHWNGLTNKLTMQKDLIPVNYLVSSQKLFPEDNITHRLSTELQLSTPIAPADFEIKHRLLKLSGSVLPVYLIEVKQRALQLSNNFRYRYSPRQILLNALTGEVIENASRHHHLSEKMPVINIRDGRNKIATTNQFSNADQITTRNKSNLKTNEHCQLISTNKDSPGTPMIVTPSQCDLVFDGLNETPEADDSARRARTNSENILTFYGEKLNQWGLDFDLNITKENRLPIVSIVHIGQNYDNAYWDDDLKVMVYGDGDQGTEKTSTRDYTLALDIAGHEFTHGIVSQTAQFNESSDPGALNEAFADIFGILIDRSTKNYRANWSIGQDLYNNQDGDSDEVAMRSLSNPHRYKTSTIINGKSVDIPFPEKYSERLKTAKNCDDDNDQCEIHANSTIWSHGAYLINKEFQEKLKLTAETADLHTAKLYFLTLTHRLHKTETMKSAAKQLVNMCAEMFPGPECEIVRQAMQKIELL